MTGSGNSFEHSAPDAQRDARVSISKNGAQPSVSRVACQPINSQVAHVSGQNWARFQGIYHTAGARIKKVSPTVRINLILVRAPACYPKKESPYDLAKDKYCSCASYAIFTSFLLSLLLMQQAQPRRVHQLPSQLLQRTLLHPVGSLIGNQAISTLTPQERLDQGYPLPVNGKTDPNVDQIVHDKGVHFCADTDVPRPVQPSIAVIASLIRDNGAAIMLMVVETTRMFRCFGMKAAFYRRLKPTIMQPGLVSGVLVTTTWYRQVLMGLPRAALTNLTIHG